jgi:hypothetical protein
MLYLSFEKTFTSFTSSLIKHSTSSHIAPDAKLFRANSSSTSSTMVVQTQQSLFATSAVNGNPSASFSLLDLPVKIRLLILELLLVPHTKIFTFIYCRHRHKTDEGSIEQQSSARVSVFMQKAAKSCTVRMSSEPWNTLQQDFSEGFLRDIGAANVSLIK